MKHNKNVKKKAFFVDEEGIRTLLEEYEKKARLLVESRKEEHILYAIKTYNGTNERYDLYCHAVTDEQLAAFTRLDYAGTE